MREERERDMTTTPSWGGLALTRTINCHGGKHVAHWVTLLMVLVLGVCWAQSIWLPGHKGTNKQANINSVINLVDGHTYREPMRITHISECMLIDRIHTLCLSLSPTDSHVHGVYLLAHRKCLAQGTHTFGNNKAKTWFMVILMTCSFAFVISFHFLHCGNVKKTNY